MKKDKAQAVVELIMEINDLERLIEGNDYEYMIKRASNAIPFIFPRTAFKLRWAYRVAARYIKRKIRQYIKELNKEL